MIKLNLGFTDNVIKRIFTGVAKWRMAQVMRQGNSLNEIFIQTQITAQGPGEWATSMVWSDVYDNNRLQR